MPDVGDLETRHQFKSIRPVGARVAGDRRFGVARRPMLHVAGLGRSAAVQPRPIPPFGVEFDPVGRVRDHQNWLAVAEQVRYGVRAGGVGAQDAVLMGRMATQPQVARPGHRVIGQWWRGIVLLVIVREEQQIVDFRRIETGQAEVKVCLVQFLQLQSEQFLIPVRPCRRPVDQEAERFHLGRGPLIAKDDRHFGEAQFASGLETQIPVHHFAVAADQTRNLEAELANGGAHAINGGVVLAQVAGIRDEPINRPKLDLESLRCPSLRKHASPSVWIWISRIVVPSYGRYLALSSGEFSGPCAATALPRRPIVGRLARFPRYQVNAE